MKFWPYFFCEIRVGARIFLGRGGGGGGGLEYSVTPV